MLIGRTVALFLFAGFSLCAAAADPVPSSLPPAPELVEPKIPESIQGRLRTFNEERSRDVTPQQNAAVYFVQMFGDGVFPAAIREWSLAMLGFKARSADAPKLAAFADFAKSTTATPEEFEGKLAHLRDELARAADGPWKANDLPIASAYLDANAQALDSVAAIVTLGKYYVPVLSEESPPLIMAGAFNFELRLKAVAPLLLVRAMRSAGAGDLESAIDDLLTCRQLAVLLAGGSPLDVSHAKAHAIEGTAFVGIRTLIEGGHLPPPLARDLLDRLTKSPTLPLAIVAAEGGERAALEQELEILSQEETSVHDYLDIGAGKRLQPLDQARLKDLDWKLAEQRALEVHDDYLAALRAEPHEVLAERLRDLERKFQVWQKRSDDLFRPGDDVIDMDRGAASRWVGETVAMSTRGNAWQRRVSDDRAKVHMELLRISLALIATAGDTGGYPATLDELRPKYFDAVPIDAHSAGPFEYVRREDGTAALISRGQNRKDDANQIMSDDTFLELPAPQRGVDPAPPRSSNRLRNAS